MKGVVDPKELIQISRVPLHHENTVNNSTKISSHVQSK